MVDDRHEEARAAAEDFDDYNMSRISVFDLEALIRDADTLTRLLKHFSVHDDGEIYWPYREDYSIRDVDPELHEKLTKLTKHFGKRL